MRISNCYNYFNLYFAISYNLKLGCRMHCTTQFSVCMDNFRVPTLESLVDSKGCVDKVI